MSGKKTKEDNTVIMKDKYLSESGIQGGKVIADNIVLGSFIVGIPFLIIGSIGLFCIFFDCGLPTNMAVIIAVSLITIIGFLLVLGGYTIYRDKHNK